MLNREGAMKTKCLPILLTLGILLAMAAFTWALPPDTETIPPELERWKPWVLHDRKEHFCPIVHDNGDAHQCLWPARLQLNLDTKGGRFSQEWQVFVKSFVPLPGGGRHWPKEVRVDGRAVPVVSRGLGMAPIVPPGPATPATPGTVPNIPRKGAGLGQTPHVHLEPGKHRVEGVFTWDEIPEMLDVPAISGLINLSIHGSPVDFPVLEASGKLWLQKRTAAGGQEDRLDVKIYRLLDDTIPMQVTSVLKMNISGQSREIRLHDVLPDKTIPMSLTSALPARLEADGALLIQARPGGYEIRIKARYVEPVQQLGPVRGAYGQEVWTFRPQNQLRMVDVDGVPGIDPKQTDVPAGWEKYPTYVIEPNALVVFKELRRGDPDPAPDQLNLKRTLWLDFGGKGFTVRDQIEGVMSRQWYLAMNPPGMLGRVTVEGEDQLITSHGKDHKPGVELRKGQLQLAAESRYEASSCVVPAVGWDHDVQSLSAELNLPPGWRLLAARGVDVVPGTWVERWTLLDLFLVLIASLAIFKLWNWRWGLLALVTLTLTYHEPDAPRQIWLILLVTTALVRFLPEGRARKFFNFCHWLMVITLLVVSLPFMAQQIRWGIYPQLERERHDLMLGALLGGLSAPAPPSPMKAPEVSMREEKSMVHRKAAPGRLEGALTKPEAQVRQEVAQQQALTRDPKALVQTGPGLPKWNWRTISLKWNGPVARDQQIRLWLLSPTMNLLLAFLRVLLLGSLTFLMLDPGRLKAWKQGMGSAAALLLVGVLAAAPIQAAEPTVAAGGGFPPTELLQQLQNRLLKAPDCLPACADIPRLELDVNSQTVRILIQVHAAIDTAVPLPGNANSWLSDQVLVDNQPAEALLRDQDGQLWLLVNKGLHTVVLLGKPRPGVTFQIPLPLRPREVQIASTEYEVQGVHADGRVEGSLQLTRLQKEGATKADEWTPTVLPPFLQVERVLALGLTWQVQTTVRRLTPGGSPVVLMVPLLAGESVTSADIRVENGQAHVNMDSNRTEIRWSSTLQPTPVIQLHAPPLSAERPWVETWILDASPIWHCDLEGITVIHHQDQGGVWKPQWQPWPGETVTIRVSRPEAIPGQLVTIDDARLEFIPGERYQKATINLKIRSSQGAQHPIFLPAGARLQQVLLNGKSQPISPTPAPEQKVMVPLDPGEQTVTVEWQEDRTSGFTTQAPPVRIGEAQQTAVNAFVSFKMPRNRWILWTHGPTLGPAVLFWSYVVLVVLVSLALGKVSWTPLRTRHWLLLNLGLTQVPALVALGVVGWFLALGWRERRYEPGRWADSNWTRILCMLWTVFALVGLYVAVHAGLLGTPDMQIAGNGSSNLQLNWMQDRIGATMPRPWVVSVPLYVYRSLMLLWALWLAWSLLTWLRWAWQCYSKGGIWKPINWRRRKATAKTTTGGASGEPTPGPSAEATQKPTSTEGC
jgi:hypothetical protein